MITLTKFTVIVPAVYQRPEVVSTMDRWICHALGSHVKDLKIAVGPSGNEEEYSYSLPQPVFNAISIQVLDLDNCKLKLHPGGDIKLPSLKKLSLTTVFADDIVVSKLLAGCPLIEDLNFIWCFGFKTLQILDHHANLLKLRTKRLEHLEQIKLEAHNLRSLELHGPSWPSRLEVVSLKNLTSLIISKAPITDKWLNEQLNKFAHLENLDLFSCPMLTSIKIWSSHIHTLHISSCKELARIEIDTPNLSIFSYSGDIISFSSNDLILSESFLIPKEIRQILSPPLCKVKELKLSISNQDESFTTAELVDAMLWISPHLQSLRIYSSLKSFFKFSYKQPTNEGESGCYKSLPVSCWNHCMEEVNIKQISYAVIPTWHYYTEDVQMKPISNHEERSYILKQDIWEKIESGLLDWAPECLI
ncbi:hypothetical protein GH714_035256 [Hevea brasiliensis]|uniref:At1g61320/AtMIF1 LRR domain-containing protein n=1 Tax=Hevea brasiliensis TaxID=3981 RepID=A0A6A6M764_HEVBR|nr:hypothetical protein GH714_035256 [Hevea brasiliensis]